MDRSLTDLRWGCICTSLFNLPSVHPTSVESPSSAVRHRRLHTILNRTQVDMYLTDFSLPLAVYSSTLPLAITTTPTSPMVSPTVTAQATLGSAGCDLAASIINVCEASTPNFEDLCFHDAQSCLCSTSGTWAPSFYDNNWSSCLAWAMASDQQFYSSLIPPNGVVQSRKCQTWGAFTATGGIPSGCNTSPLPTSSSASPTPGTSSTINSSGAAAQLMDNGLRAPIVLVMVHVVNMYIRA